MNKPLQQQELDNDLYRVLGQVLKARRKAVKKTQLQIAQAVGLTKGSICGLEKGTQRIVLSTLVRIAAELNTSASKMIREIEKSLSTLR